MLKLKRNFDSYSDNNTNNNNISPSTHSPCPSIRSTPAFDNDYDGQAKRFRFQQQQQQQQRTRSEYQFFNEVQSPIDQILDNIKNKEPNTRINNKNSNNINNNTNNNIQTNMSNTNNTFNFQQQQPQQKLFTLAEVEEIVKKAVKQNEENLKQEYEKIVKEKLIEQYQCFSRYNEDYLSRQMKESEYSYIS
ncbi:hypothetical protein ACTFIV_009170 [Dictyostelium citrinum]